MELCTDCGKCADHCVCDHFGEVGDCEDCTEAEEEEEEDWGEPNPNRNVKERPKQ